MKKKLHFVTLAVFVAIFLVSGFALIRYFTQINRSEKTYQELADIKQQALVEAQTGAEENAQLPLEEVATPEGETVAILPEYAPIYERNSDTVGWIRIDGTNIDYPVVQRKDTENYYLHRDFYGNSSNQGTIYVREQCDVNTPSDNVVIYGHRTNAGTMFGALQNYKKQNFWKQHQYIQFDTLTEHHKYQIVAVFTIQSTRDSNFPYHLFVDAQEAGEFENFVSTAKSLSLYDTGVSAAYGDKLITLSTCEGSTKTGRLVVVAKRVE